LGVVQDDLHDDLGVVRGRETGEGGGVTTVLVGSRFRVDAIGGSGLARDTVSVDACLWRRSLVTGDRFQHQGEMFGGLLADHPLAFRLLGRGEVPLVVDRAGDDVQVTSYTTVGDGGVDRGHLCG